VQHEIDASAAFIAAVAKEAGMVNRGSR